MFDETTGMEPLEAYEALMEFAQSRGEGALRLAMHAAVPQGFRADLLHLLRLNFVPEASSAMAEADVLLASMCEAMGGGYFQFDPEVRRQLLENLADNYAEEAVPRVRRVATFLLQYIDEVERKSAGGRDWLLRDYLETQRWVALAFIDPDDAAGQLAEALSWAGEAGNFSARIQLGGLASALSAPLVRYPQLLAYAAGLQALETGQEEQANALLTWLGDEAVTVGGTTLRPASVVLAEWRGRSGEGSAAERAGATSTVSATDSAVDGTQEEKRAAGDSLVKEMEEEKRAAAGPQEEPPDWQRRILWVDDRPENNLYLRRTLESMGIRFTLALSTREALEILSRERFAATISDMGRVEGPREGYVLLDAIRKIDRQIPFFIYSGLNDPTHKREALERGAQGSTNLPRELIEMVTRALSMDDVGLGDAGSGTDPSLDTQAPVSVLFLAANPSDTARLGLDQEYREIESAVRRASQRDRMRLEVRWAVKAQDVFRALLEVKPKLVHFSGHGGPRGIILEGPEGEAQRVDIDALVGLMAIAADHLECVILNTNHSGEIAEALSRHIDVVIGMTGAVSDRAAIAFSSAFYAALGDGRAYPEAFEWARTTLQASDLQGADAPRLYRRASQGSVEKASSEDGRSKEDPVMPSSRQNSMRRNPFEVGSVVVGEDFIGRTKTIQTLRHYLAQGQSILLLGERRMGKTSLLLRLVDDPNLRDSGMKPLYLDLEGVTVSPEKWLSRLIREFRRHQGFLDVDYTRGEAEEPSILEDICEAWCRAGQRPVLMFDEGEFMLDPRYGPPLEHLGVLRSLANRNLLSLVLSCQRLPAAETLRTGLGSPVQNILRIEYLPAWTRLEAEQLLDRAGDLFGPDIRAWALEQAGTWPFLLQQAAALAYDAVSENSENTQKLLSFLTSRLRLESRPFLDYLWRSRTDEERELLALISKGTTPSPLRPALADLVERGLVVEQGGTYLPAGWLWGVFIREQAN